LRRVGKAYAGRLYRQDAYSRAIEDVFQLFFEIALALQVLECDFTVWKQHKGLIEAANTKSDFHTSGRWCCRNVARRRSVFLDRRLNRVHESPTVALVDQQKKSNGLCDKERNRNQQRGLPKHSQKRKSTSTRHPHSCRTSAANMYPPPQTVLM
jgi:hypothetical protein